MQTILTTVSRVILIFFMWPAGLALPQESMEFTDNEYLYSFQFPRDWKMKKPPPSESDRGESRVLMVSPDNRMMLTTMVVRIGKSLTKEAYDANPSSEALVAWLTEFTVEEIYKKMSQQLKATKMVVSEKRVLQSSVAMQFYISTLHFLPQGIPAIVAGIHAVPFTKDYMVCFLMSGIVDKKGIENSKVFDRVFNTFQILGEKPMR